MGETKMNEIECKIAEALRILDLQDSERAGIATQAIRQAFQEQRVQYEMKIAVLRTEIERLKNAAVWLRGQALGHRRTSGSGHREQPKETARQAIAGAHRRER